MTSAGEVGPPVPDIRHERVTTIPEQPAAALLAVDDGVTPVAPTDQGHGVAGVPEHPLRLAEVASALTARGVEEDGHVQPLRAEGEPKDGRSRVAPVVVRGQGRVVDVQVDRKPSSAAVGPTAEVRAGAYFSPPAAASSVVTT